ncbi:TetR/AcrR family transcriptional regulator [Photobacterium atrarenae]|uniref:TetR/AcrR family transcriptional regulator n=1 Tax=Photobacterium atrarenae TaxID=865757 RepID=A0ABY5GG82_9GAMM|nr:TetR/AcrR family transcriptional regulator [Photobacterium atrarenae]UTV27820.1 TetR/AcrR family transcriptional regulator [Photobacterium atrarenae]
MTSDNTMTSNTMTQKKKQLLDAALTLFSRQGIEATSTASIAKQANVATGTLFHHFASKQALVIALYQAIKTELGQAMQTASAQEGLEHQVRHCWQQALCWAQHNPAKILFMQHMAHSPYCSSEQHRELMVTSMTLLLELLDKARCAGLIAPHPEPLVLNFCHSHFLATAGLFAEHPALAEQPEYQDSAFEMLWRGLSPQSR